VPHVLALNFPEISELLVWPDIFPSFNKIALIAVLAVIVTVVLFVIAARQDPMVAPTGARNIAETSIEFVEDGIVMQTMGRDGLGWTPVLLSIFFFVFLTNITEIIPTFQMPANARMAIPASLALFVWVVFNGVGIKHQGFGGYLKSVLFPPGVPKALYILVTPIEFISVFLVRPFSLAVRLFANMLAGHILLVTFAILTDALITANTAILKPIFVLPLFMLIFLTAFEVLVSFLQAYIFTILTAVYIGGAAHPEH
jgi:F-type H+-transporting ATPase subunit a